MVETLAVRDERRSGVQPDGRDPQAAGTQAARQGCGHAIGVHEDFQRHAEAGPGDGPARHTDPIEQTRPRTDLLSARLRRCPFVLQAAIRTVAVPRSPLERRVSFAVVTPPRTVRAYRLPVLSQ